MKNNEKTTFENYTGGEWYREKIIEMVEHINSVWMLKQIYRFILSLGK